VTDKLTLKGEGGPVAVLQVEPVAEQIRAYNGNLAAVGRHFGVTRQSVHKFVNDHPALRAVVAECRESMKDHAESSLYRAVLAGEAWAVCFYLKTQAKDRGYIERYEHAAGPSDAELDAAITAELGKLAARGASAPPGAAANGPPHA
jgi:hypothetical protein